MTLSLFRWMVKMQIQVEKKVRPAPVDVGKPVIPTYPADRGLEHYTPFMNGGMDRYYK
jgi:hypothetical protein